MLRRALAHGITTNTTNICTIIISHPSLNQRNTAVNVQSVPGGRMPRSNAK